VYCFVRLAQIPPSQPPPVGGRSPAPSPSGGGLGWGREVQLREAVLLGRGAQALALSYATITPVLASMGMTLPL